MEHNFFGSKFYNSKLNTILLLALIILMIVALRVMSQNKEVCFNPFAKQVSVDNVDKSQAPIIDKSKIEGNKDDLISFSIWPDAKVHGVVSYRGTIKGAYFFEGNILVGIAGMDKKIIFQSNGIAKTDWMTSGPVDFEGNIDFSKAPLGPAYLEIHNDNASGLPENDKNVLIPIIIE